MRDFEDRGSYELLDLHTVEVDAGGYRAQIQTFITKGQPFPMVNNVTTGRPGWPQSDPQPEDESSIFMTVITASLDENGEPDMTLDRNVLLLNTRS
jgi:hypothetical protein